MGVFREELDPLELIHDYDCKDNHVLKYIRKTERAPLECIFIHKQVLPSFMKVKSTLSGVLFLE